MSVVLKQSTSVRIGLMSVCRSLLTSRWSKVKTDSTSNAVTDARDAVSEDAILGGVMRCSDAHSCAWGSPSFLDLWVLIKFGSVSFSSNLENIYLNICHVPFLFGRLQLHLYKAT